MKDYQQFSKISDQFEKSKNIVIVTHRNPDGDAIGSSLALKLFAESQGKTATVILSDPVPDNLTFLSGSDSLEQYNKEKHFESFLLCDTVFILDLNSTKRLGPLEDAIMSASARKIMIDHHEAPEHFADLYLSVPSVISTAVPVYELLEKTGKDISKSIAEALYVGIITDSGNFRFPGTDARVHQIAGKLLNAGANPEYLYDEVYNKNRIEAVHILGEALRNITLHLDGKLSMMLITSDMLNKCGAKNADVDNFAEKTLSIAGTVAGVLLSDMDSKEEVRISMRSKGDFSVREVAANIGGGGHFHAAGAREFNLDIFQTRNYLVDIFAQEMKRQGII